MPPAAAVIEAADGAAAAPRNGGASELSLGRGDLVRKRPSLDRTVTLAQHTSTAGRRQRRSGGAAEKGAAGGAEETRNGVERSALEGERRRNSETKRTLDQERR